MKLLKVRKRSGQRVSYDRAKIFNAIAGANRDASTPADKLSDEDIERVTDSVEQDTQGKRNQEKARGTDHAQFHGIFQTQLKHGILPHILIVLKPDKRIFKASIRQTVPDAPEKGNHIEQKNAGHAGKQEWQNQSLFGVQSISSLPDASSVPFDQCS